MQVCPFLFSRPSYALTCRRENILARSHEGLSRYDATQRRPFFPPFPHRSLGLVDLVGAKQNDWIRSYSFREFLALIGMGSMAGGAEDGIRAFTSGERWKEGTDFFLGRSRVLLSWNS